MPVQLDEESSPAYPGWQVTLAAFVGVMVSFAAMVPYTFSLFLEPLHASFGWTREAISNAFAITALTVAACSPTIGTLLDRLPPRRIILPAILVFAAAMASLALLRGHIALFYGTYLVLGIVGNGTAQLAYSRAVLTWFERRRGLAIAVMLTGSGTGAIVLPLIAQHVMTAHGWRASYLTLGALALIGFPLTAMLVRNRPAAANATSPAVMAGGVAGVLRTRVFWFIALPVTLSAFSLNAAIAHLAAMLSGRGITPATAALALSVMALSGIIGRLITGHFIDRFFAPTVAMIVIALAGAGVLVEAYATTAATALLGACLMGAGAGSEADVTPYLIAKYFGRARFSTLYGLSWTAYAIGGAIGPVIIGHAFDQAGSYVAGTMALLAIPCFIAAVLQFALPAYPARTDLQSPPPVELEVHAEVAL